MRKSILFILLLGVVLIVSPNEGSVFSQDADSIPPRVIDVWPLPGVELAGQESLSITFNQAMNQQSVQDAFATEPDLAGVFMWSDERTVEFVPVDSWPRDTEFTVSIADSAQSAEGITMDDNFETTAKTVGPLAVSTVVPAEDATGVTADARIVVTFNRPVVALGTSEDMLALPSPITITPEIAGTGEWLNTSIYMFNPDEALKGGSTYTVTVADGLSSVDGAVLDTAFEWSFETLPPQILSIRPSDNSR